MTTTEAHVVLLGTSAGRIWPEAGRSGTSSALVVGDRHYVVDLGYGWGQRYQQHGLGGGFGRTPIKDLAAVFLTHLHSDHVVGLADLVTFGLERRAEPVRILGPGPRGRLVPLADGADEPAVVGPEDPTPGTRATFDLLCRAFAADLNDNVRDSRKPVPHDVFDVRDVDIPEGVVVDPDVDPAPPMEPFAVFEDDRVRVTATLVDHRPVFPALGYRFETDAGAVTFSGDTCACPNLVRLARDTDVLLHEVNDAEFLRALFSLSDDPADAAKLHHLLSAHTDVSEVGAVAEQARAGMLVLTHFGRTHAHDPAWSRAGEGYGGDVVIGTEGMRIDLPARPRPIEELRS